MTKKQLKAVVADYATALPDWSLIYHGTALARNFGPIEQLIGFEQMTGSYRPIHGIRSLALPDAEIRMLPQHLTRPTTIRLAFHSQKWPEMLAIMEQEFKPDIRKPLDIAEVLALCEERASAMPDSTNNMAMLAILSAWLGRDAQALDYCERMQHCPLPTLAPMPEWEEAMRNFGRELAGAIAAGSGKAFLEDAISPQSSE